MRVIERPKTIIGITGKARAGKDTIANHLVTKYGFHKTAFAKRLKDFCNVVFNFTDLSDEAKEQVVLCVVKEADVMLQIKALGVHTEDVINLTDRFFYLMTFQGSTPATEGIYVAISPRVAYQKIGTELFRDYDENFWTSRVDISQDKTVICDLRFDNEARFVQEKGGIIWYIERSNTPAILTNAHASENGISIDYINTLFTNTGSIELLHKYIDEHMEALEKYNGNK